jgi:hypothetical protein
MYDRNPPQRLAARNRATGETPSEQLMRLMRQMTQVDFDAALSAASAAENETLSAIMHGLEAWRTAFMAEQQSMFGAAPAPAPTRKAAPAPAPTPVRHIRAIQLDLFEE